MEVRKVTLLELGIQLLQFAATVVFAFLNRSIWALVMGKLVADFVKMAVSHRLIQGYQNRFAWNRHVLGELLSFGKWIFASTALTFLSSQSDRLVLGKLVSMATLGLYGVAFALADIPRQIIMAFRGYVGLPFVSKFSRLPRTEFRATLLRYRRIVLAAGAVLLALGVNCSDLVLVRIFDHRYHDAAWMVPILALGLWHTILYCTSMPCLTVLGKVSYNVIGYVLTAAVLILGLPLGFAAWGLIGAIWLIAFSDLPVYVCNLWGLWKENLLTLRQDLEMTVLFVAICGSLFWLRGSLGIAWSYAAPLR
jgi:O-antigen/teichoic acid export membrane protein